MIKKSNILSVVLLLILSIGWQETCVAKNLKNHGAQRIHKKAQQVSMLPSYVIMNEKGQVLKSNAPEKTKPIASITKLMLAWVLLKEKVDWNEWVQITEEDVDHFKKTTSRLPVGSVWTKEELLKIALVASDNRAAHALARASGGIKETVMKMNEEARKQKWTSMVYFEPTGLNQENKSNALDLMHLGALAWGKKEIQEAAITDQMNIRGVQFKNTNGWIRNHKIQALVSKTGFTNEAGRCIQLWIQKGEKKMGIGILGAQSLMQRDAIIEQALNQLSD